MPGILQQDGGTGCLCWSVDHADPATASHSLGEMLGLGRVGAKEVYAALDWLGSEQPFICISLNLI